MLTEAQIQYITEVLGTSIEGYLRAASISSSPQGAKNQEIPVAVLTPPLKADERDLLDRILASVHLKSAPRFESDGFKDIQSKEAALRHALIFRDDVPFGRHQQDDVTVWGLHSLSSMVGDGPAVAQSKKAVWALLQQFNRERLGI